MKNLSTRLAGEHSDTGLIPASKLRELRVDAVETNASRILDIKVDIGKTSGNLLGWVQ